jgi:predicted nucleic acid-binding protein
MKGRYHDSFRDSLILQSFAAARAEFLLSGDFQKGQGIESMTVRNPFL